MIPEMTQGDSERLKITGMTEQNYEFPQESFGDLVILHIVLCVVIAIVMVGVYVQ